MRIRAIFAARLFTVVAVLAVACAAAEAQQAPNPIEFQVHSVDVRLGLEAGAQVVGESGLFWNLARVFAASAGFNPNRHWEEFYAKPSVNFEYRRNPGLALYGGLSAVGSYTQGKDAFAHGNSGRMLMENYFVGVRLDAPSDAVKLDVSGGAQPYKVGDGMLIQAGAGNGFERGALIFAPRVAWARTIIVRLTAGPVQAHAYYLEPNDLASSDTHTAIAGGLVQWTIAQNQFVGVTAGEVLTSTVPSVQAASGPFGAPKLIPDGRKGLEYMQLFWRWNPLRTAIPGLWVAGDVALERNPRIHLRAWAAKGEIGYALDAPWRPTLSIGYTVFSGDNPSTTTNERFDPLYYEGSPTAWASGGNASLALINSNLNVVRLTLQVTPTQRDIIQLQYWRLDANQLFSPLQFGQGTRAVTLGGTFGLVSGVPKAHLADDLLLQYTRVINAHTFLTAGLATSFPGPGMRALVANAPTWVGGYANLVLRY